MRPARAPRTRPAAGRGYLPPARPEGGRGGGPPPGRKGWFAANQRTPAGIESAGTKVLDRNGSRNDRGRVEPFAPATLFVTRPMAADSQTRANENAATIPTTANQSATEALGRNPSKSATPVTAAVAASARTALTATRRASSAPRVTAIVRIRSTKP